MLLSFDGRLFLFFPLIATTTSFSDSMANSEDPDYGIPYTRLFALPRGFVKKDEDINQAARKGLQERTGLSKIYLDQFLSKASSVLITNPTLISEWS